MVTHQLQVRCALGTLRHQDTSALNYSAEVSGQFGTGAEVSVCTGFEHFGIFHFFCYAPDKQTDKNILATPADSDDVGNYYNCYKIIIV